MDHGSAGEEQVPGHPEALHVLRESRPGRELRCEESLKVEEGRDVGGGSVQLAKVRDHLEALPDKLGARVELRGGGA